MENSNSIEQAHTQNLISDELYEKILNCVESMSMNDVCVWINPSCKDGIKKGDICHE